MMGEGSYTRNTLLETTMDVWLWLFPDILAGEPARPLYPRNRTLRARQAHSRTTSPVEITGMMSAEYSPDVSTILARSEFSRFYV